MARIVSDPLFNTITEIKMNLGVLRLMLRGLVFLDKLEIAELNYFLCIVCIAEEKLKRCKIY